MALDTPVEFPDYDLESDPRPTLVRFMEALKRLLDEIVWKNRDPFGEPILEEELIEDATKGWDEANEQFYETMKRVADASDDHLREHGLTGWQLRLKLRIVRFFANKYVTVGRKVLPKLLSVIDDVLDSIVGGLPGGKAVSEIKDAIKNCVAG